MGIRRVRPDAPVEMRRTLRASDPCLACGAHVMSSGGEGLTQVMIRRGKEDP
jgi:Ni,Fe-hydrogenase I large subunit